MNRTIGLPAVAALAFLGLLATTVGRQEPAPDDPGGTCVPASGVIPLPAVARESSGVGFSRLMEGLLWTHNDSGWRPELVGVDQDGVLVGTLQIEGVRNVDWEDMEVADCGEGSCIWIADTGDNLERRRDPALLRFPEVPPGPEAGVEVHRFPVVLPDGPRDIEALFVLPGERPYLVTKGRRHPVTLYRYPLPLRRDEPVLLEEVQVLFPGVPSFRNRVTGASSSPDGSWVAIRSYSRLYRFQVEDGGLRSSPEWSVSLLPLGERQGEGVGIGPGGRVALTSEAGIFGRHPTLQFLACED